MKFNLAFQVLYPFISFLFHIYSLGEKSYSQAPLSVSIARKTFLSCDVLLHRGFANHATQRTRKSFRNDAPTKAPGTCPSSFSLPTTFFLPFLTFFKEYVLRFSFLFFSFFFFFLFFLFSYYYEVLYLKNRRNVDKRRKYPVVSCYDESTSKWTIKVLQERYSFVSLLCAKRKFFSPSMGNSFKVKKKTEIFQIKRIVILYIVN